jgi:sugar lactone lactonase YvrE
MTTPEVVEARPFVDGIVYGEGPRWHHGRLWFTDGPAGRVYSAGEDGGLTVQAEVPKASGLGWLPDGTLVVSALFDAKIYHVDARGEIVATFDVSDMALSTNDLLVTPGGLAYVDLYEASGGAIGCFGSDGEVRVVASALAMPNGLGLLPDGTLVASETRGSRISAFTVQSDGGLGAPTVFADLGPGRQPDGLCVDVEGGVWVGCVTSGEFLRVVKGGTVTHRVAVDGAWAVAPALGGADGRTLYMVVDDTTFEGLAKGESTGWILQARVEVPGAGSP